MSDDERPLFVDALLECGMCHRMIQSRHMAEHVRECALLGHPTEDRFD